MFASIEMGVNSQPRSRKRGLRRVTSVLALAAIAALTVPVLMAEEAMPVQAPTLRFKLEKAGETEVLPGVRIEGLSVGIPVVIDAAFTTTHQNTAPSAPFRVIVPRDQNISLRPGGALTGVPELVGFYLPDESNMFAAEILRFTNLTVPQGRPALRVGAAASLLARDAVALVTEGYEEVEVLDLYATTVGHYDAVSLHLQMSQPKSGTTYLVKVIAILQPDTEGGVLGVLMADRALSEVRQVEDLASRGMGLAIIHSLEFLD